MPTIFDCFLPYDAPPLPIIKGSKGVGVIDPEDHPWMRHTEIRFQCRCKQRILTMADVAFVNDTSWRLAQCDVCFTIYWSEGK
jgi:hypothetical protein